MKFRKPRFRTATLLWLVVVVSAFFIGRQSDEIGARLSQIWQGSCYRLIDQPDGSLLFVSKSRITGVSGHYQKIVRFTGVGTNQVKLAPQADGNTPIVFWQYDKDTQKQDIVFLDLVIANGRIIASPSRTQSAPEPAK